jgi:hypothetical protein
MDAASLSAAADQDDEMPPVAPEIAALQEIVGRYAVDNARLAARIAELERESPGGDRQLKPLKSLVGDGAEFERARRARRLGLLESEKHGGRLFSTARAVAKWRRMVGR